jgi:APA family basic amino acid/polyamine antiporter
MYAYAGWNAATYIVEEVAEPTRNVPRAIGWGTLLVALLYMALNAVFLMAAPMAQLKGKVDVGHVAADGIFGHTGGAIMSGLICLGLVSSISAMTWVGPRVTMVLGQDVRLLGWFARCNAHAVPGRALWTQFLVVVALLLTSSFEKVLGFVQFSIQLCSFLTVVGLFWLRRKRPDLPRPVRAWGHPWTALIFLAVSAWMMAFQCLRTPWESVAGLLTACAGLLLWWLSGLIKGGRGTRGQGT